MPKDQETRARFINTEDDLAGQWFRSQISKLRLKAASSIARSPMGAPGVPYSTVRSGAGADTLRKGARAWGLSMLPSNPLPILILSEHQIVSKDER